MGSSFVSIGNEVNPKGFWINDGLLEVTLRLLALHVKEPHVAGSLAAEIRDQWLLASRGYFVGSIPHGLDKAHSSHKAEALIRDAIHSFLDGLSDTPSGTIPPEVLNLMGWDAGIYYEGGLELRRLIEVCQALVDLLDGKITADSSDSSFMPGRQ